MAQRPSAIPHDPLEQIANRRVIVATTVVVAIGASVLIFTLRDGLATSRLSASGAEYGERLVVAEEVWNEKEILDALADMDAKHLALARPLSEDLESLRRRAAVDGATDRGDKQSWQTICCAICRRPRQLSRGT